MEFFYCLKMTEGIYCDFPENENLVGGLEEFGIQGDHLTNLPSKTFHFFRCNFFIIIFFSEFT